MKDRLMAVLIHLIMILGPILIMFNTWNQEDNHAKSLVNGQGIQFNDITDVFCTDSVEVLATLFLVVVFEIVRFYSINELHNHDKMKYLPGDTVWLRLGELTNMFCMVLTVLALPLIFWTELMAKDIVYDSMGMLFIFAIDDIAEQAL